MPFLSIGLANAEAKSQTTIQACMGQIQVAAAIQPIHEHLRRRVTGFVPEANQVQGNRSRYLEVIVSLQPRRELLRQTYMLTDMVLQAFDSIVTNYKP